MFNGFLNYSFFNKVLYHIKDGSIVSLSFKFFFLHVGMWFGFLFGMLPSFYKLCLTPFVNGYCTGSQRKKIFSWGHYSYLSRGLELINPQFIKVGSHTFFAKNNVLETWYEQYSTHEPCLKIGDNCSFGEFNHVSCFNRITIGNGILTGRFVLISDNSHGKLDESDIDVMPSKRIVFSKGEILIGDNVWIGDKVSILSNVKIGECSVIAANSVVCNDVPAYSVVAGCPAKVVKIVKKQVC